MVGCLSLKNYLSNHKNVDYLKIYLAKDGYTLHIESYKILLRDIWETKLNGEACHIHELEDLILLRWQLSSIFSTDELHLYATGEKTDLFKMEKANQWLWKFGRTFGKGHRILWLHGYVHISELIELNTWNGHIFLYG